jgi:hypothetical protein
MIPGSPRPNGPPRGPFTDLHQVGYQNTQVWAPGEVEERPIIESLEGPSLWRLVILGPAIVRVTWGTAATNELTARAPLAWDISGKFTAKARPIDAEGGTVTGSIAFVTAARSRPKIPIIHPGGGAVGIDDRAAYYTALVASTLTVATIAVAAAPFDRVPLVAGSALLSGSGMLEFDL